MGREDYCTSTVDGAAGFEACRQRDFGPWDDDQPTLADVDFEDEDDSDDEDGDEEVVEMTEKPPKAREQVVAEGIALFQQAIARQPDEWNRALELAECGKNHELNASDFVRSAFTTKEILDADEDAWAALHHLAELQLKGWAERANPH